MDVSAESLCGGCTFEALEETAQHYGKQRLTPTASSSSALRAKEGKTAGGFVPEGSVVCCLACDRSGQVRSERCVYRNRAQPGVVVPAQREK